MVEDWRDFFVATAGASAALLGFIFVSVSINLKRILAYPKLPNRTLESLLLPVTVLFVSCCGLVPSQSAKLFGGELIGLGLLAGATSLGLSWGMLALTPVSYRRIYWLNLLGGQLTILPYWLTGGLLQVSGWESVHWLLPGVLLSFVKTVYDAWILLIEINR